MKLKRDRKSDRKPEQEKPEPTIKLKDDASFLEDSTVASANECTGLMPSAPATEDEAEEYQDLYAVPAPPQWQDDGKKDTNGPRPQQKQ